MQSVEKLYPLIDVYSTFDAVVLCNGDYPTHAIPLTLLKRASYVCCCDSAAVRYIDEGNEPQAIIGDGDSLPVSYQERYAHIFRRIDEQDDNDQTKATRFCMAHGMRRIAYIGSTGKREDHTLGNIALLMRYHLQMGIDVTMITDYGYFTPVRGNARFQTFKGQQVSMFNFGCKTLMSRGLKWETYPFDELWQGTLNEALSNEVEIWADGSYMLYRTFEAKVME